MRTREWYRAWRLLALDGAGSVGRRPVGVAFVDGPKVTLVATGAKRNGWATVAGRDAGVGENSASVVWIRSAGALDGDASGRAVDVEVRVGGVLRLVLEQDDSVRQIGVLSRGPRRNRDRRLKPMDGRHYHRVRVPDGDLVRIGGGRRQLDVVPRPQVQRANSTAAWQADRLLRWTGGAARGPGRGRARKVLQQVAHGLVVDHRIAGRHRHEFLRSGQCR